MSGGRSLVERPEPPEYQSEAWYEGQRHLSGGELFVAALAAKDAALRWHSAYIRLGDIWFKPRLTES